MNTIHKSTRVLALVAESDSPPRFTDLVAASGYPRATLHRLLGALVADGLVELDARSQTYRPGLRLLEFAHRAWRSLDLNTAAADDIERLSRATGETVHLAVLDGADVVYVHKRESDKTLRLYSAVGKRGPAYCTGVGKAMLAFVEDAERERVLAELRPQPHTPATITNARALRDELANVRRVGYATDLEEHEPGVCCVAAPIIGQGERLAGAISITVPSARFGREQLAALAPLTERAAGNVSRQLRVLHSPDW